MPDERGGFLDLCAVPNAAARTTTVHALRKALSTQTKEGCVPCRVDTEQSIG